MHQATAASYLNSQLHMRKVCALYLTSKNALNLPQSFVFIGALIGMKASPNRDVRCSMTLFLKRKGMHVGINIL